MSAWCRRLVELGGQEGAWAETLLAEEAKKDARMAELSKSIGLPVYESRCFALPSQTEELLDTFKKYIQDDRKLSLRLLDQVGQLLFRDVDAKAVDLPAILSQGQQRGARTARLSPYRDPDVSGTLMVSAGDTCLEMAYGPHYWLTKTPPEGVEILRCQFRFPFISVKYSTEDVSERGRMFRHLKNVVYLTLGLRLRELADMEPSVYAEFHWQKDDGYRFLECSFAKAWTGGGRSRSKVVDWLS